MPMSDSAESIYDTHAAVRQLKEAGMPEPQAEVVVSQQHNLIRHNLATKTDIETVRGEIETLRLETKGEIEAVRGDVEKLRIETKADMQALHLETNAVIEALRQETKGEIASVRGEIEKLRLETKASISSLKLDLLKWNAGMLFTATIAIGGIVLAALRLLPI